MFESLFITKFQQLSFIGAEMFDRYLNKKRAQSENNQIIQFIINDKVCGPISTLKHTYVNICL